MLTSNSHLDPPRVAIIGAGFSGALLAVQLLLRFMPRAKVFLFERNAAFGRGVAYATGNANHLLNVRANRMSAFADQPDHFVRWLQDSPAAQGGSPAIVQPDTFVPRGLYGTYIQELLAGALWQEGAGNRLTLVPDEAVAVAPSGGAWTVEVAGGRRYEVDAAVLAIGNILDAQADAHDFRNPWDPAALKGIDPDATVVLIGSGLTMVDTVISLLDLGHRGPICAVSRRGLLPRRHGESPPLPPFQLPDRQALSVVGLLRELRARIEHGGAESSWRSAVDALRPVTQALWFALSQAERERFLRHLRPWWDVHRHRMAPAVADIIDRAVASGQLELRAARIVARQTDSSGVRLTIRPRGRSETVVLRAARVIDCSGPICDYTRIDQPLVRDLLRRGLARPDALRLGVDVTPDNELIGERDRVTAGLFAIGPVTRGTFWEITSVPDIREQCWHLAALIAARLDEGTDPARGPDAGPAC